MRYCNQQVIDDRLHDLKKQRESKRKKEEEIEQMSNRTRGGEREGRERGGREHVVCGVKLRITHLPGGYLRITVSE